jgi:transcriptional regulator with PAS, ATPase and Fis domain
MALPQQETQPKVKSRKVLELMLANGEEFVAMVQKDIDAFKLPYAIKKMQVRIGDSGHLEEKFILEDTLSPGELHLARFITVDDATILMKEKARKAALTPYEVLISGATGTGKEIIARGMVANRQGAFRAINCAGLPEGLIESILFGHVKGSFTGAYTDKNGFIIEAENGVMFLDEIGEMPMLMQAKLLRTIQEKVITKVGSTKDEPINCKFVFATNRDLGKMVEEGKFREDLYARIATLELDIKPLKERVCDCVPICKSLVGGDKFLDSFGVMLESGNLDLSHNVRSLQRHVIRYAVWGSIN